MRVFSLVIACASLGPGVLPAQTSKPPAPQPGKDSTAAGMSKREDTLTLMKLMNVGQVTHDFFKAVQKANPEMTADFWKEFEGSFDENEFFDLIAPAYEKNLSQEDIRALIAFYRTAAGKHYIQALPKISEDIHAPSQELGNKLIARAAERLAAKEKNATTDPSSAKGGVRPRAPKSDARTLVAKSDLAGIEVALEMFENDNGRCPSAKEGLAALQTKPARLKDWQGPYLREERKDPWGRPYVYLYPGKHNPNGFDVFSSGPDGKEGGGDDVNNWGR